MTARPWSDFVRVGLLFGCLGLLGETANGAAPVKPSPAKPAAATQAAATPAAATPAATEPASATAKSADEAAVRQAGRDYVAALEKGDSKALAEIWTADGTFTDSDGHTYKVRESLQKGGGKSLEARQKLAVSDVSIRFVTPDVAIESGTSATGATSHSAAGKERFTAMWVRKEGQWKIDSLRETRVESPVNTGTESLAALNLFSGEWTAEMNHITIHVKATWNPTKRFLRREFTLSDNAKASTGGSQEIGWDPQSESIHSWTFNNDGSTGEGTWSLEGSVWMTLANRYLPDGRKSSAVHVYQFRDKDTLVWKSIHGRIDGEPSPDFEVVFKRVGTTASK